MLQAVDSQEIQTLLPAFLSSLQLSRPASGRSSLKMVDLGCGTGRTTLKLLLEEDDVVRAVVGLDASPKMLELAKRRCWEAASSFPNVARPDLTFELFDAIADAYLPSAALDADGVVSTLVLEHLPLHVFFRTIDRMLGSGACLLLTNMHADMGAQSQAGFVDPVSGEKIRPESFVYTVDDVLAEASRWGMHLVGKVRQRDVSITDVETLGVRSKKWIGTRVWFGMILRKRE